MVIDALGWGLFEEIPVKLRIVCAHIIVVVLHKVNLDAGLLLKFVPSASDQGSTRRDSRRPIIKPVPSQARKSRI